MHGTTRFTTATMSLDSYSAHDDTDLDQLCPSRDAGDVDDPAAAGFDR